MNTAITFDIPAHSLTKIALKLESLLQELMIASQETHPIIHQCSLFSCIEILNICSKPELKSRFLKELIRIRYALARLNLNIGEQNLKKLARQINYLSHQAGKFSELLAEDSILQLFNLHRPQKGQDIYNQSPQLHLWLHANANERQHHFRYWIETLTPLIEVNQSYLSLLRTIKLTDTIFLDDGYYQYNVSNQNNCLLISVDIEPQWNVCPKVQLGHNRLTITLEPGFSIDRASDFPKSITIGLSQL